MNAANRRAASLPTGLAGRLNPVCDRFEEQWLAGATPRLEEFLPQVDERDRPALVRELVELEVHYRGQRGEHVTPEELCQRLPEYADRIASAFSTSLGCGAGPVLPGNSRGDAPLDPDATELPAAGTSPTVGMSTSSGTRFRILRSHAKGGLGEVFLAHDEELHRQVALKHIQDRHARDAECRARFLVEAEITGGLEHPGIVPVYSLGADSEGRPFYAMRFIKGNNLKEAIGRFHQASRERQRPESAFSPVADAPGSPRFDGLEFRQLLGRFIAVCNAVAYAHSRGVLHRDLKPSNIMLGKFGETLIVDWGLAKAMGSGQTGAAATAGIGDDSQPLAASGSGDAATVAGSTIGTPAYMSPEQAAGKIQELGPATDVYSLGATLFTLLTNCPPVQGQDAEEVLKRVQRGDLDWQSGPRSPGAPPGLVAVCRKAMALKPQDRYATPLGLSEDVEHWLADRPVSAHREPWPVRAGRWMRQHRALATSTAAVLLVTTLFSMVASGLLANVNRQLEKQNLALDQANLQFDRTNADLQKTNGHLDNANQSLKATNDQLGLARKDADNKKRQAVEEKQIAQAALTFLQEDLLLQANPRHQADRLLVLGNQNFQTVENPTIKELLNRAAAELTPEKIEKKFPNQPLVQAQILHTVGSSYQGVGDYPKAVAHFERAHALFKAQLGQDHLSTLRSMNSLASGYKDAGKLDLALKLFKETLELRKAKLGPDHPDTLSSMNNLAFGHQGAGQLDLARQLYVETLELMKAKLPPGHPDTLTTMNNLAYCYQAARELGLARQLVEETLEFSKANLGPDHPLTLTTMNNLAVVYAKADQLDLALPLFEETLERMKAKLGPDHPKTLNTLSSLATGYYNSGKLDLALPLLEETVKRRKAKLGPNHPHTVDSLRSLAMTYLDNKQPKKALPHIAEYVAVQRQLLGANDPRFASRLFLISLDLLKARQFPEAETLLRECLAFCVKNRRTGWTTSTTQSMLGAALLGQKKYADAEPLLLAGALGLARLEKTIPAKDKVNLTEAEDRLMELFAATRTKDETKLHGKLTNVKTKVVHEVKLSAGKPVVIQMRSQQFDTYLVLADAQGKTLAENDDIDYASKNTNSRIVFVPPADGVYRIMATSYQQRGRGDYEILIWQYSGKPK